MSEPACDHYLHPYREAVKRFGPGFHATLWSNPEAQKLRFDVMSSLADFANAVVLDAGCGAGDFALRLLERGVPFARYVGVDAMVEMIAAARARDLPRCEFFVADLLHDPQAMSRASADYVCISGTLNTMQEDAARTVVLAAFQAARQAVIFNFLSNRPDDQWHTRDPAPATRFNTIAWLDWALTITSRVSFTQDYMDGHDATIMLRHDGVRC